MTDVTGLNPEKLNELFFQLCEDHKQGKLTKAMEGYSQLLALFPDASVLHYNLGLVMLDLERIEDARNAFVKADEINPDDLDTLFNLAITERLLGRIDSAIDVYQKVLLLCPEYVDAWYNLGSCYRALRNFADAENAYLEVLRLQEDHVSAASNLAFVYTLIDAKEKALACYRKVLRLRPEDDAARHMVAALAGEDVTTTPDDYIRSLFDNYSERFENSLLKDLEYQVPAKLRILFQRDATAGRVFQCGLDIGCGTGLGAEAFRDLVTSFEGIDLSSKMVTIAGQKKIYNKLWTGNYVAILLSSQSRYDFFIAADVFAYLGALDDTFSVLRKSALPGAILCCSTESLSGEGFKLLQSGRFAHSPDYIKTCAARNGWSILGNERGTLRREKDSWINGDLWIFQAEDSF